MSENGEKYMIDKREMNFSGRAANEAIQAGKEID